MMLKYILQIILRSSFLEPFCLLIVCSDTICRGCSTRYSSTRCSCSGCVGCGSRLDRLSGSITVTRCSRCSTRPGGLGSCSIGLNRLSGSITIARCSRCSIRLGRFSSSTGCSCSGRIRCPRLSRLSISTV